MSFESIGLEPSHEEVYNAINGKKFNYNIGGGFWKKGAAGKEYDSLAFAALIAPSFKSRYKAAELVSLIEQIAAKYTEIEGLAAREVNESANKSRKWLDRWKNLIKQRFSDIDKEIWDGVYYTVDTEGRAVIVTPTGKGSEYRTVGVDDKDVYGWFKSLFMPHDKITRLAYIDRAIVDNIIDHTVGMLPSDTTPASFIDGTILSSAAAGKMFDYKIIKDEDTIKGFALTADIKLLTVRKYIEFSLEALMCRPERRIDTIKPISNEAEEPCYRYIPLEMEYTDFPNWCEWLSSSVADIDKVSVFMSWIGSTMYADNKSKQTLYLHGLGSEAKSKVANALIEYFGEAAASVNKHSMSNQFGLSKLENKRLVVIGDNKNNKIISSEWVHNLTGGDAVDIEKKNKDSYSSKLFGKLLILSNIAPEIKIDEKNQTSRLIYMRLKPRSEDYLEDRGLGYFDEEGKFQFTGDSNFEDVLKEEMQGFLAACMSIYNTKCPNHSEIPLAPVLDEELMGMCSDSQTAGMMDFIEDHFLQMSGSFISTKDLTEICQDYLEEYGVNHRGAFVMSDLYSMLYNKYRAVKGMQKVGDKTERGIIGLITKKELMKRRRLNDQE